MVSFVKKCEDEFIMSRSFFIYGWQMGILFIDKGREEKQVRKMDNDFSLGFFVFKRSFGQGGYIIYYLDCNIFESERKM